MDSQYIRKIDISNKGLLAPDLDQLNSAWTLLKLIQKFTKFSRAFIFSLCHPKIVIDDCLHDHKTAVAS